MENKKLTWQENTDSENQYKASKQKNRARNEKTNTSEEKIRI